MTRGVVLAWHRVAEVARDPWGLAVPPPLFAEQVEALGRRFEIVALEALVENPRTRGVAFTFDDGARDALTAASPVLQAHAAPATFFVNSGHLDGVEPWWSRLERAIADPAELTARHAELLQASAADRARRLEQLVPADHDAEARTLNRSELRELAARAGHMVGSHGRRHLDLTRLDVAACRAEIEDDRRALETLLGRAVTSFAYPYGFHDESVVLQVARAGFRVAVTTRPGVVDDVTTPLRVPRVDPGRRRGPDLVLGVEEMLGGG